jgi:hypothetical protein
MTQRPGLYRQFETGQTFDALDRLHAIATRRGTSLGRPGQLALVREALDHPLTEAERRGIEEAVGTRQDLGLSSLS